ncbi:hypothetical protein Z517_05939 [Fonsecaea pedrosoi CBS 271.37]|uniref:Uncharacterized protein n=1 Tax=Fonsecaea pedrosoi CBS 271.37 TaxID=1442368 RepID=A0A0D2EYM1_9EURO|nr:uncharacterized protein Z517_05939 [Fonsecaea pedrosoi CBS 271.37]KIW79327.1 hypothetical protein Z517_05939 [Fonsecaea pedrosoi CBS 271.37]
MAENQMVDIKEVDIAALIAALRSAVSPLEVDAEEVARRLGMSLASIPPKFTRIRKQYHIDIKVVNSGALQRNRQSTPKKRVSRKQPKRVRTSNAPTHSDNEAGTESSGKSSLRIL